MTSHADSFRAKARDLLREAEEYAYRAALARHDLRVVVEERTMAIREDDRLAQAARDEAADLRRVANEISRDERKRVA